MNSGWFAIDGVQSGDRTLREQLAGLEPAFAGVAGKSVADLGCAEGLIAREFEHRGASVYACDNNAKFLDVARQWAGPRLHFELIDLRELIRQEMASGEIWRYDIVLALAILHKLPDPEAAARFMAAAARERIVVRLPLGSEGVVKHKHGRRQCDLREVFPDCGLVHEQTLPGPRGELVMHWVRARAPQGQD